MRLRVGLTLAISIFCVSSTASSNELDLQRYEDRDAYSIYSLLLPHEESYGFASDNLVISEETMFGIISPACLTSEASKKFRGAIVDFDRMQKKRWRLQSLFQIQKTYRMMDSRQLSELPNSRQVLPRL